jgi:rubrerythrin
MDEPTKRMAQAVLDAMRAEAEGHHFYRMAAGATEDSRGRRTFEQLAVEELGHLEFLRKQYRALVETGRPDAAARLGTPARLEGESPIFSPAIRGRLGEAHFEMTALSVGVQLELGAETFYKRQAEAATSGSIRSFFEELAAWEAGHYRALLAQQESLKEDYWSSSGFAPF